MNLYLFDLSHSLILLYLSNSLRSGRIYDSVFTNYLHFFRVILCLEYFFINTSSPHDLPVIYLIHFLIVSSWVNRYLNIDEIDHCDVFPEGESVRVQ